MLTNVAVLYSGTAAERPALGFAAAVAEGLGCSVACRYARDMLSLLDGDQRAEYRAMIEIQGIDVAQRFLVETYEAQLAKQATEASQAFHGLPEAKQLIWGETLALRDDPKPVLAGLGYMHDMVVGSFELAAPVLQVAVEQVLVAAGAPLALIAHAPQATSLEGMAMVYAWKPSAAAKHALRYALPLFKKARQVYLVSIEEEGEPSAEPSVQEIADYLMNVHSVATSPMLLAAADDPALQLADFYREVGADLLVLGAYSHSRLQRLLFGGFTSHFLKKRPCNLLLAH
jgi:nucleotide-binding universal stress UspA family protein